ncbi:MAG: L-threonylcarbamoyladenylate synthase [Anaerovoracaceae bacterium]
MDAVIQGENCRVGIESTVVDMTEAVPVILRPGVITAEELRKFWCKKLK